MGLLCSCLHRRIMYNIIIGLVYYRAVDEIIFFADLIIFYYKCIKFVYI